MSREFDDASSEYLETDSPPLSGGITPFSYGCWFRSDDATADQTCLSFCDKDAGNERYQLELRGADDDTIRFMVQNGGAALTNTSTTYSANTWHHVMATDDGTDRAVYLDAGGKGSGSLLHGSTNMDRFSIGRAGDATPDTYFSGAIAEISVWNAVLTDAEVAMLAAGYSPLFVRPGNLVYYLDAVRDADQDIVGGISMTAYNTPTVSAHPRIIRPSRGFAMSVPVGGGPPANAMPMAMNHLRRRRAS